MTREDLRRQGLTAVATLLGESTDAPNGFGHLLTEVVYGGLPPALIVPAALSQLFR